MVDWGGKGGKMTTERDKEVAKSVRKKTERVDGARFSPRGESHGAHTLFEGGGVANVHDLSALMPSCRESGGEHGGGPAQLGWRWRSSAVIVWVFHGEFGPRKDTRRDGRAAAALQLAR